MICRLPWKDETIGHAYHRIFDEALNEYNDKQKRADRKIQNYHQHIMLALIQ
ncbi:MAG: hypothetical protein Q4F11_00985 [Eubacteriales bacterium]|nr:hypothetical protein [Eubacteriales bacterium]